MIKEIRNLRGEPIVDTLAQWLNQEESFQWLQTRVDIENECDGTGYYPHLHEKARDS